MPSFVGIATSGRMDILAHALVSVAKQTRLPDRVYICTPIEDEPSVYPCQIDFAFEVIWLRAPRGSCAQRNAILDELSAASGVALLMDDDFILAPDYLERLCMLIAANPHIAIVNGALAADGISGPGLKPEEVPALFARKYSPAPHEVVVVECDTIYGCNMGINLAHVHETRFDEALPLYGWQEDVDFSSRLRQFGTVARTNLLAGVHLGVKLGRTSGIRFGYSQVANPIYLVEKGTMSVPHAVRLIVKNIAMNTARSLKSEQYIDRRGRLRGNMIAFRDLLTGKLEPSRILHL